MEKHKSSETVSSEGTGTLAAALFFSGTTVVLLVVLLVVSLTKDVKLDLNFEDIFLAPSNAAAALDASLDSAFLLDNGLDSPVILAFFIRLLIEPKVDDPNEANEDFLSSLVVSSPVNDVVTFVVDSPRGKESYRSFKKNN